jgi:hypothetical protein
MNKRAFVEYAAPLLCERVLTNRPEERHDSACSAVLLAQELWKQIERLEPGRAVATGTPDPTLGGIFPR